MIIRARAPLRLGLAGGGTDVSPYCDEFGGAILNATIDRYAYAFIEIRDDRLVEFVAADQEKSEQQDIAEINNYDGELRLHRGVYRRIMEQFNGGRPIALTLRTFSDAPAGSGLGSSSTLVVAMVKAFTEYLNLPLGEYEIAHLAFEIERNDVGLKGGRQDQYAATFGGFNYMEFYKEDRVIVNPLRIKNWIRSELEASLVLFYTGVSRESASIIKEQSENMAKGSDITLESMHSLKRDAITMKESLLKGDFYGIVDSMRASWEAKKRSADSVSNESIDEIYEKALESGALAGKVSGAGGGGFMMFFVNPNKRMSVIRALNTFPGQVNNCHFTEYGTQGWKIL